MKKSVYSFGDESPMKFEISDKLAKHYNEAIDKWFKAQQRFNQKFGRKWDPRQDPIELRWNSHQQKAWNEFGKVMKKVIDRDGPFHENDVMDDFLVKNAPQIVSKVAKKLGVGLTLAVAGGVLYGLLNRR